MKEIWKDINGFEGIYQISNLGTVKTLNHFVKGRGDIILTIPECIRKPRIGKQGYFYLDLKNQGISQTKKIHRLVAEHFINGKTDLRNEVNHIDGNKLNNHFSNLEWVSRKENAIHASKNNLLADVKGFKHANSITNNAHVKLMRTLKGFGFTYKELSIGFGLSKKHIASIVKFRKWKHIK